MSGLTANSTSAEALAAIEAVIPQTLGADLLGTLFGLMCVVLPFVFASFDASLLPDYMA